MKPHVVSGTYSARWTLRERRVQKNNIALVPASKLASLQRWQERARMLPAGDTLIVVPTHNLKLQEVSRRICLSLNQRGRRSTIIVAN